MEPRRFCLLVCAGCFGQPQNPLCKSTLDTFQIHVGPKVKKKQKTKKTVLMFFCLRHGEGFFFFFTILYSHETCIFVNWHSLNSFILILVFVVFIFLKMWIVFHQKVMIFFLLISKARLLNGSCHVGSLIIYFYWVSKLNKCRCKATKQTWQARSCGPIREDIVIII